MSVGEERGFLREDSGRQFLVISVTRIGRTNVMELVSVEDGTLITIFSPPRKFRKILRLDFGSSGDSSLVDFGYDTSELLRPLLMFEI